MSVPVVDSHPALARFFRHVAMGPGVWRSAVAQLGALVEYLAAGADELAIDP